MPNRSPPHIYPTTEGLCPKIAHVRGYTRYHRRGLVDPSPTPQQQHSRPHSRAMDQNSVHEMSQPRS